MPQIMTRDECVRRNKGFITLWIEEMFGKKLMQKEQVGSVRFIVPSEYGMYDWVGDGSPPDNCMFFPEIKDLEM